MSAICCRGLDNKCHVYKLSMEEDVSATKRTVAVHTGYMSCCQFDHSDNQVSYQFAIYDHSRNDLLETKHVLLEFEVLDDRRSYIKASRTCKQIRVFK